MKNLFKLTRLWVASLLLLFGVSQPTWAATERYIYCGISNDYQNNKTANDWGFNFWGGTLSGGVKAPTWIQDNYNWDNRNYTIYRVKVGDDNNKAQFKGNSNWWVPEDGKNVTLNGTTNNAVFFSSSKDGWDGQFQQNYQETSTASLTAGSSTTTVGTQVTLTPALTSKSDVNEIKSTAYSVTTNPGSAGSVSNGKFSATAGGTYVIKATITYNPKGFTGITKTVDATTTITVEEYQVTGSAFSGWGTWTKMAEVSNTDYTITITDVGEDFKLSTLSGYNDTWYKSLAWDETNKVGVTQSGTLSDGDNANVKLASGYSSPVVLHLNPSTKKIWAVATKVYTVTYAAPDKTSGSVPTDANKYEQGATVTVLGNTGDLAKTGYSFASWKHSINGNTYTAGQTFEMGTANVTMTAQWTANTNTPYTVKHYKENLDGTYPSEPFATDNLTGTTGASVTPAVKTGSDITGFTAPTPQTVTIAADGSLVVTYNYTRNSHTLTWNADGGTITGTYTSGTVKYGATITAPANANVTKDGFNFNGWHNGTAIVTPATTMPDNDLTYTAQWLNAETYTLTVNKTEGITEVTGGLKDQPSVPFNSTISATLAAKGYTFTGWTAEPAANASFADASALSTTVTVNNGSVTVTANAEAKTTRLTLLGEGGTPDSKEIIATYGQPFPQDQGYQKPTRTGYNFNGYYINEGAGTNGTQIITTTENGAFASNKSGWTSGTNWDKDTETATLHAHWTATKSNKLTLSKNFKTTATHTGSDGEAWITFDATAFTDYVAATSSTGFTLLGYALDKDDATRIADAEGNFLKNVAGYTDENGKWINPAFPTGTIYAIWEEALTTLTIAANEPTWGTLKYNNLVTGIDWGMTTPVGVDTQSKNIIATAKTGYIFTGWTIPEGDQDKITYTEGSTSGSIVVNGTGIANSTATIQANFIEDLSTGWNINLGYDGLDHWITTEFTKKSGESTGKIAYVTANLETGHDYKFKYRKGESWYGQKNDATMEPNSEWTLDGNNDVKINVSISGEYTFRIDYSTSDKPKASYTKPSVNALNSNFTGSWARTDGTVTDGVLTVNYEITQAMVESQSALEFEMIYDGTYYGPGIDKTEMTVNNHTNWELSPSTGHHIVLKPSVAGPYTFVFTKEGAKLDATYPTPPTYTVTMANDGHGTTTPSESVELNAFTGTQISATPATGYHFDHWEGTTGIAFASTTSASTTATANQIGTITAHFAANTPIYFQNTMQDAWGTDSMFVYFYKDADYWNGDKGTGSQISNASFIAGPCKMTRISRTNIWEYAYDPTSVTGIVGVVFADRRMKDYDYFTKCNATRRMDFGSGCANMFVLQPGQTPDDKNTSEDNTVHYYGAGFWRNYNSLTSKMYLHIWDCDSEKEIGSYELLTDVVGNESFSATVNLSTNKRYNVYVRNCTGSNFSQKVEITSENCSGFDLYEYGSIDDKSQLAYLTTKSSGDYVFTLTFDDAHMLFSVEYPVMIDDYRVKIGSPVRYSNIIRAAEESGNISMFLNEGANIFTYDKVTNVNVNPIVWTEDGTINVNVEKAGVYTMTLHKNKTIDNVKPYTGNYYVRTDCAQGGWNEYKTNDNNLMRFTDRNPKFVKNPTDGFNYYYCRWNANASGNVRFVVANDINACISDTMKADEWLDDNEALKGMANIRFGWNSNTNALSRAYISGSYDADTYLRILSNDDNLFEYTKESSYTEITAKQFKDENDWTYTLDVLADGGAGVAVSASYNGKYQSFVGEVSPTTGEISKTEQLLEGGTKQHLHLVYDFKTDRLVSGWVPGGDIDNTVILDADMLLARVGQGDADQINITNVGAQIKEIKTIYAVLQLNREKMLSPTEGILAEDSLYTNAIYWFSLPFDVKVNDIFGVDGYGTKWVLQYYDGAKRAKIGFFAETETFWTYLGINDTIKANVGYAVCLDPDYFDSAEDEIWANNRQSVCFYFPSTDKNLKIVGNKEITISVPAHECKIDRTFGDNNEKNHMQTDSHWNVIGSPAFKNMTGTTDMGDFKSLYEWDPSDNTYKVADVKGFTFQSTSAYLVQFHGDIKWQSASVIINAAPRYTYADEKNYTVELQFHYGSQWDRTYVALKDNANEDFVLNEDLTKMINSGQPNIYSFAGAYDVAYNGTAFKDQIVNLGVIARKNGSYTFAMPKDFSGSAILVDLESGEATDLNVSNYTVELNKGTYNNRFQLILKVEASTPTNIDNVDSREWSVDGKTKKLLINDQIYLINGGRVYNATGAELR